MKTITVSDEGLRLILQALHTLERKTKDMADEASRYDAESIAASFLRQRAWALFVVIGEVRMQA